MHCFAFVFLAIFAVQSTVGDRLENTYLPPRSAQSAGGNSAFLSAPSPLRQSTSSRIGQGSGFGQGSGNGQGSGFGQATSPGKNYLPPNRAQSNNGNFGTLASASSFNRPAPTKLRQSYDQSGNNQGGYNQGGFNQGGYSQGGEQGRYKSAEQDIPILKFSNENNGDGNYAFSYETGNGIKAEEVGKSQGESLSVQGGYSYTGPDGVEYSVSYVADENGFHAAGDHLPTSPPIPEAILRALEQNERDEANGIVDDGTYKGDFGSSANIKSNFDNSGYRY